MKHQHFAQVGAAHCTEPPLHALDPWGVSGAHETYYFCATTNATLEVIDLKFRVRAYTAA